MMASRLLHDNIMEIENNHSHTVAKKLRCPSTKFTYLKYKDLY